MDRRAPWADAWGVAQVFPVVGTGLNTYGVAMLFFQRHNLDVHYAQAHNDYLQLLAEGGLLLALPALAIGALLVRDVRRRFVEDQGTSAYWIRAGAVASLIAIALQETVDFSLQMPGNAALFAVVCGIALHKAPAGRPQMANGKWQMAKF
jgi:O-antigen ligase